MPDLSKALVELVNAVPDPIVPNVAALRRTARRRRTLKFGAYGAACLALAVVSTSMWPRSGTRSTATVGSENTRTENFDRLSVSVPASWKTFAYSEVSAGPSRPGPVIASVDMTGCKGLTDCSDTVKLGNDDVAIRVVALGENAVDPKGTPTTGAGSRATWLHEPVSDACSSLGAPDQYRIVLRPIDGSSPSFEVTACLGGSTQSLDKVRDVIDSASIR